MKKKNNIHWMCDTSFYNSWRGAKWRCNNENWKDYNRYWWRWITFSEDWNDFNSFYNDMFSSYKEWLSLDRIDNSLWYFKENCRWVTNKENSRNTRQNINITYNWKTQCIAAWADEIWLNTDTLWRRINIHKWSIEDAISTPKWYPRWVDRVSNIVSFKFPFEWNIEQRFISWLKDKGIKQEDYMNIAQSRWTEAHKIMENYMNWIEYTSPLYEQMKNEIDYWKAWIDELNSKYKWIKYLTEKRLVEKNKKFAWTIDLVRINEKTKEARLYDFKTFGITQRAFDLPQKLNKNGTPPRPTEKLKKLSLQLSLYAYILEQQWWKIMGLYGVWLHNSWCYEYEVERWNKEELEKLISEFIMNKKENERNLERRSMIWMKI